MSLSVKDFEKRIDELHRLTAARESLRHLRLAHEHAKIANIPRTKERIRLAITSCGGAIRNRDRFVR